MARIKTRDNRHTAEVRYKGVTVAQTFHAKTAAANWAKRVESAIDEGKWPVRELLPPRLLKVYFPPEPEPEEKVPHRRWTLAHAFKVYLETVTPAKKGSDQEKNRINAWRKRAIAGKKLHEVTADDVQGHIKERLEQGRSANTIRNEVFLLSALYRHAAKAKNENGWGLQIGNPTTGCSLPPQPPSRKRRIEVDESRNEEAAMRAALADGRDGRQMVALFTLAIETGMRLSELRTIRVSQIKTLSGGRVLSLPDSKNAHPRNVVLSTRAKAVIDDILEALDPRPAQNTPLFTLDLGKIEYRWKRARQRAGVEGLRWHDLRHEGISRMAEKDLTVGELQEQSGHRTVKILVGYIHARVDKIASKLG